MEKSLYSSSLLSGSECLVSVVLQMTIGERSLYMSMRQGHGVRVCCEQDSLWLSELSIWEELPGAVFAINPSAEEF